MSKATPSKLDPFAERLDEWFGVEKKTLKEVQAQLALDGCSVSLSRLSEWWEARTQEKAEARLLSQIASGAEQVVAVRKHFAQNAPPQLEMLIDLHRVLVMQMSTQAAANPDLIKLADQALRTVMEYVSGQTKARLKERELALAEGKWAWIQKEDLDKALAALHAELKALPGGNEIYQSFERGIREARERAKK